MTPITYDPPVTDPAQIVHVPQTVPDRPDVLTCWLQGPPVRTLPTLKGIAILVVASQASTQSPDHYCVSRYLTQAGCPKQLRRSGERGHHRQRAHDDAREEQRLRSPLLRPLACGAALLKKCSQKAVTLTVTELQNQIASVEGFRISFERFGAADTLIEPYPYDVMAPSKWRISDWKRVRLAAYIGTFKAVVVFQGDDTAVKSDMSFRYLRGIRTIRRLRTLDPEERPILSEIEVRRGGRMRKRLSSERQRR